MKCFQILSFIFSLALLIQGCSKSVTDNAANSLERSVIEYDGATKAALEEVPEAKPYVDEDGDFDYGAARVELGAPKARELRLKWAQAITKARTSLK